jgi:hypothetical protein
VGRVIHHDRLRPRLKQRLRVGVGVNSDISSLDWLASAGTARTYVHLAWAGVRVGTGVADSIRTPSTYHFT